MRYKEATGGTLPLYGHSNQRKKMPRCKICKKGNSVGNGGLKCKCKGESKMKIEIELPEIDGFEYTGEYRFPKKGDWFVYADGDVVQARVDFKGSYPRFILKPVEKWIPANLEYIQEHYKWGESVEVRVMDNVDSGWSFTNITYYDDLEWDHVEIKEVKK
jgi:hypothetical protein